MKCFSGLFFVFSVAFWAWLVLSLIFVEMPCYDDTSNCLLSLDD